ncbi:MAG: pentapeptide repeat-containing protein [Proteobacteria bacterium]|nr:pentapeptide repeat-containing protein [Pseudomonadota bacterium]
MIYTDEADKKDYCLFHAPAEHKGMTVEDFNKQVLKRIDEFKTKPKTPGKHDFCNLSGTIFPGEISFGSYDDSNPLPHVSLHKATFVGVANFEGTMFSFTTFSVATFAGNARFGWATFAGGATFVETVFEGQTDFRWATFTKEMRFERVKAEKNAQLMHSLNTASLANLNFTSMETECFSFKGCDWPDGGLWPETEKEPSYKAAEELYRSLKQKAASEHDQPMVSKWHYREKLMALEQIKAKRGWKARLGLTGLYYWCSGFGEDPAQAFRVLAGLLGVAFLALCGFKLGETGFSFHRQIAWNKILEIPAELLALIPFVKTEATTASSPEGILAPVKAIFTGSMHILLAAQIALFAFALRNRFRR